MARLLGRESVSSDVAALFELVKNSYDADATDVTISFEDFSSANSKDGKIIIEDNGDGMTYDEIKYNWMVIGTYSKDDKTKTKRDRRVVGNKGIGRFATERLASEATIITKPRKSKEEVRLYLDWNSYEGKNITFNDIEHDVEHILEREDEKIYGTTIILTNLRENWNSEKILNLKTNVASIVLPPELARISDDKFDVTINAKGFDVGTEKRIHSLLFKHAPFKLTATILDERQDFKVKIQKMNTVVREEYVDMHDYELESGENWKPFGECKLVVYFFPGQTKHEEWNKYYRTALKISKIQGYLEEIHGIKIYRDNFWVRPYGEKGNDWLNLEKERVQSNLRVGNSQVIGFVKITQDGNPGIIDTTTRERLVENISFESMTSFGKETIRVLNEYRIEENKRLRERKGKIEHQNVIEIETSYLHDLIEEADLPVKEKKAMKTSVNKIKKVFSDYKGEMDEDLERIASTERAVRNLASLGISSATTSHEIANIVSTLAEIPKSIMIKIKKTPIPVSKILEDVDEADKKILSIKQFMLFIRHFVKNLREDFEAKHEKTTIRVGPDLRKLLEHFSPILKAKKIDVKLTLYPDNISVYMNRSDLESVIINLLTNSIKALDKPENKNRKIKITVQKDARHFKLRFSDNGPGISENNKDKVFRLFFSTHKAGTGLGLPIVKEIVEEYDGKVEIKSKSELEDGATFEIILPFEGIRR